MTAQQYGFWDVCRALAHQSGTLFFNGPGIAARFQGMHKSTAYNLADALTAAGWFKLTKESTRRRDGTFSPKQYRVLSHEEWAEEHPGVCESLQQADPPFHSAGMEQGSPFQNTDSPFQNADSPFQPSGNNLIVNLSDKNQPHKESDNHRPFHPAGMDGFVQRFSKRRRKPATSAAAPIQDTPPFHSAGTGVQDTRRDAERLSVAIANTLGLSEPELQSEWAEALKAVLDKGYPPDVVSDVVAFAHSRLKPGTMQREGAANFVAFFDKLHEGWLNSKSGAGRISA